MSETTFAELEQLALSIPCYRCGARRETPCVTPDGSERAETHRARRGPIDTAYFLGKEEIRMKCYARGIKIDF